jgi:lipid A disaccharide synthetase
MENAAEPWFGTFEYVTQHSNKHIEAMAASDLGVMYDGQMVGQAAACHLPTMILSDMRMNQIYYHTLMNRWLSNMNLIADKDIFPELLGGQAWFGKITDTLASWYLKP